jgi:hypothetical protein
MKTFLYSFLPRFIYKYGIVPANLILLFYLLGSALGLRNDWLFIFPLLISVVMLYALNKFYLKIFKSFPFRIDVDNEKIVCSGFVKNNRKIEIQHSEITKITGSIFSGRTYLPLYIFTENSNIGISPHIKGYNELLKIILTNVKKELYEALLDDITKVAINNTLQNKKKK